MCWDWLFKTFLVLQTYLWVNTGRQVGTLDKSQSKSQKEQPFPKYLGKQKPFYANFQITNKARQIQLNCTAYLILSLQFSTRSI